jgi:hypothetical protein
MQLEDELSELNSRIQILEHELGSMKKQIEKLFKTKETKRNSKNNERS